MQDIKDSKPTSTVEPEVLVGGSFISPLVILWIIATAEA
jgi:hypothetical protein